jgi:hypothetical protein
MRRVILHWHQKLLANSKVSGVKGTVQQDLTGIERYIIPKVFLQGCPVGIFFQILSSCHLVHYVKPLIIILYKKGGDFAFSCHSL